MASFFSVAGPKPKLSPIQPKPRAETSNPLFPSVRFCIFSFLSSLEMALRVRSSLLCLLFHAGNGKRACRQSRTVNQNMSNYGIQLPAFFRRESDGVGGDI